MHSHRLSLLKVQSLRVLGGHVEHVCGPQFHIRCAHRHCSSIELVESSSGNQQKRKLFVNNFIGWTIRNTTKRGFANRKALRMHYFSSRMTIVWTRPLQTTAV